MLKHSDSNRWTYNEIGPEEGEVHFTLPNAGNSRREMLIIGSKDDRVIKTEPLGYTGQYNFITAEALMARLSESEDPEYSKRCLDAAVSCFEWCMKSDTKMTAGVIGSSIQAAIELFKTTKKAKFERYAAKQAALLAQHQADENEGEIRGFYYESPDEKEPYKNIWNGCMEFYSIYDLIEQFPGHKDVNNWKEMVSNYAYGYLTFLSDRNEFGIAPFGLYTGEDPGGNRKAGNYWYRYFMQPELDWWVGINANVASAGIGLLKAAKVLDDPELKSRAQKQLDWIVGVDPFNSSTLVGVGYNHPKHFAGSTYYPLTPVIPGAVLDGLGGDHNDQPDIGTGGWQISEYWTPIGGSYIVFDEVGKLTMPNLKSRRNQQINKSIKQLVLVFRS